MTERFDDSKGKPQDDCLVCITIGRIVMEPPQDVLLTPWLLLQ